MWLFFGLGAVIVLGVAGVILSGVSAGDMVSEADIIAQDIEIIEV